MANLTLKNIVKKFGQIEVLHGISLDIEDGEFVGTQGSDAHRTL
jgi:ABC-type sugar transport system ATPase subunit